ncbi:putative isoaspartyl peptidase/L-asparaginase 3 [Drosera capensis]
MNFRDQQIPKMAVNLLFILPISLLLFPSMGLGRFPIVVSTWPFVDTVRVAWRVVDDGLSAVEAVVEGCSACEDLRCDGTGYT